MKTTRTSLFFLIICVVGTMAGYVFTNSIGFNLCIVTEKITEASCINFYERVGNPIFYGMSALSLVFLVLIFLPHAFTAWKKFAVWFIPIATLLFVFYPEPGSGDLFSPYPEQVFKWVSIIYVVISILIIVRFIKKD